MRTLITGRGKLLLTGEYFVLDGAMSLALPTKPGQAFYIHPDPAQDNTGKFLWESYDWDDNCWFRGVYDCETGNLIRGSDVAIGQQLSKFFKAIITLRGDFAGYLFESGTHLATLLDFPRLWGLGTSSTLIYCLAQYFKIDPFVLSDMTLGGSGYDIACAGSDAPIYYQRKTDDYPSIWSCTFNPVFKNNLYFVYLNKKQNSREGIQQYRAIQSAAETPHYVRRISDLTFFFTKATDLIGFDYLVREHEMLISRVLKLDRAKDLYFSDFWGEIKSLGAWGGDFVLATSNRTVEATKQYFRERGFNICLKYEDLILNDKSC
jgi:mevalonate kinase